MNSQLTLLGGHDRTLLALNGTGILFAVLYAALIPAGLPGDEPSHFDTVQFYSHFMRMPVLGEKGVSYEGQMGPIYYSVAAIVYRCTEAAGEKTAFFALRLIGTLLVIPEICFSYRIIRRLWPDNQHVAAAIGAFIALNPSLVAIRGSIQNDELATVFCLWATHRLLSRTSPFSSLDAVSIAAIVSLAVLTKSSTLFLVASIPLYVLLRHLKHRLRFIVTFCVVVSVFSGWWFVRNQLLYGDFTAQKALRALGYTNAPPPIPLWKLSAIKHWVWVMQSYAWMPIQYYRDLFHAPHWLRLVVAVISAMSCYGWLYVCVRSRGQRPTPEAALLLGIQCAVALAIYAYTCMSFAYLAPRVMFGVFVAYACVLGGGVQFAIGRGRSCRWVGLLVLALTMILANVYCLCRVSALPEFPFYLFLKTA